MEFNARDAYDALVSARSAPSGEAAGVDVVQLARDVVLAEQEFRRAGKYLSGEAAEGRGEQRGLSDWAKGLGWGALAAASVTPWGSLGRLGRAARLGQDVFEGTRNVARSAEVAGRWDIPEGVDDLTRSMMEFQREAGVPFDKALAAVNRTRVAEGFEPVGDVARGGSGLPAGRVSSEVEDAILEGQPGQGEGILGAVLSPVTAPQQFGAVSAEGAQRIFDVMAARGPLKVVSAEDLRTPGMLAWLDALGGRLRGGSVTFSGDYPEFTQFQSFADALGLNRARLLSGQRGQTFRPMMQAIAEGRYDEVLDDLAGQVNNVFTLLDDDVFRLAFYPFMSNSTFAAARASGTDVTLLSAVSGVASAGSNPIQEARLVGDLFEWAAKNISVSKGSLVVPSRGDVPGMLKTPATAYAQLVNNPDWLSNQVPGLASKTYVYAMLKLNPKMARALVIDRVDASARLAAFELDARRFPQAWSWATEGAKATEGVELALGGFAARVVAAALDVPPSAVQENVWALWRVLRDLQVGGGTSRVSSVRNKAGETMEQILSRAKMPTAHRRILEQNMERLRAEVAGGGAASRYWEFSDEGVLIPRTDMPIDGYLPPAIRTPENVEALAEAVGNADRIGRGLRDRRPWAPIALALTVLGTPIGKSAVAGGAVGGILGAGSPAEASDGSITSASIPFAATGIGTGLGAVFGAAAAGAGAGAVKIIRSATGKSRMFAPETVKSFGRNRDVADDIVPNLNSGSLSAREMDDIQQFMWNPSLYDALVGATKAGTAVLPKYQAPLRELQDGFVDDVLFSAYDRMSDLPEAEILALEMNSVKTHVDALLHWQHVGNKNIQSMLRNGDMPWHDMSFVSIFDNMTPEMEAVFLDRLKRAAVDSIVKLDELTLGLTNEEAFITYRGANRVPLAMSFGDDFLDALRNNPDSIVGMEFEDIAYTTTSLKPGYAAWMANTAEAADGTRLPSTDNVLFQIEVPAGTTSAPVSILDDIRPDHYNGAYYRGEAEILLPRSGVFEVTRVVQPEDIPLNTKHMTMVSLRYKGSTIDPMEARRPTDWTIEEIP